MCRISDVVVLIFLLLCSVSDIRTKRISTKVLIGMSLVLVVFRLLADYKTIVAAVYGMGIGVIFLLISRFTKEAIGYGDSWIILLLGGYLGGEKLLLLITIAFFFAGLVSLAGFVWKKWSRKYTIPFIPFLTLAYAGVIFI